MQIFLKNQNVNQVSISLSKLLISLFSLICLRIHSNNLLTRKFNDKQLLAILSEDEEDPQNQRLLVHKGIRTISNGNESHLSKNLESVFFFIPTHTKKLLVLLNVFSFLIPTW